MRTMWRQAGGHAGDHANQKVRRLGGKEKVRKTVDGTLGQVDGDTQKTGNIRGVVRKEKSRRQMGRKGGKDYKMDKGVGTGPDDKIVPMKSR